jgi:hypothetical protein
VNERWTVLFALLGAELGGTMALLVAAPESAGAAGFTSVLDVLVPHAGVVAAVWGGVAGMTWVLAPKLWRIRQELSSKLRLLGWVCVLGLLADNLVSLYLYLQPVEGVVDHSVRSAGSLAVALLLRTVGGLIFFWLVVLVHVRVDRRRVPQVTPPPKFGRD